VLEARRKGWQDADAHGNKLPRTTGRDQHLEPFIVQAVWLVGTLAALLISARRPGRGPAQ
jgi:hypothetical protein